MEEQKRIAPAPIDQRRFSLAEHTRQDFTCNAADGTTVEDILKTEYWSHVGALLQPLDRIEVRHEFGSWIAECVVLSCGKNWAKLKLLQKYDLEVIAKSDDSLEYRIEHKGAQHKWSAIRIRDNEIVQSGFQNKSAAEGWLKNHEAATA
jgi:hypothetical protein